MPYDESILADLTEEEREALAGADDDTTTEDAADVDQENESPDADTTPAADDADGDAAADAADADAGADDANPVPDSDLAAQPEVIAPAAEPAQQPQAASAPLLVIQAPADAQAQLDAIAAEKATLIDSYESGDLTAKEYQVQLDAANARQLDLTLQMREAQLAQRMEEQRIQNQWVADCNRFLASHPEYADATSQQHKLLNETIMAIARMPSNAGLSNDAALAKAHRMVQVELGEPVTPVAKTPEAKIAQPKVPRPEAMPNIGNLPAAGAVEAPGNEFAKLDKLQSSNPDAYEDALMKMSAAQRERYLRAA